MVGEEFILDNKFKISCDAEGVVCAKEIKNPFIYFESRRKTLPKGESDFKMY